MSTLTSVTSSTITSSSSSTPFMKIPNTIINLSLTNNHYILPLYLYSYTHASYHNSNIVDTNLTHITSTYQPTSYTSHCNASHSSAPSLILSALDTLLSPDVSSISLIQPVMYNAITPTSRLQYYFSDASTTIYNCWTKLTYAEYYYIIDLPLSHPEIKYNLPELLNLYLYYKQHITLFSLSDKPTTFSTETIAKQTNISRNTVTKYSNQLQDLGLITITTTKTATKASHTYTLSNAYLDNL